MKADPRGSRHGAQEEIRKILFAPPRTAWTVDEDRYDGVRFAQVSAFELGAADRMFGGPYGATASIPMGSSCGVRGYGRRAGTCGPTPSSMTRRR